MASVMPKLTWYVRADAPWLTEALPTTAVPFFTTALTVARSSCSDAVNEKERSDPVFRVSTDPVGPVMTGGVLSTKIIAFAVVLVLSPAVSVAVSVAATPPATVVSTTFVVSRSNEKSGAVAVVAAVASIMPAVKVTEPIPEDALARTVMWTVPRTGAVTEAGLPFTETIDTEFAPEVPVLTRQTCGVTDVSQVE